MMQNCVAPVTNKQKEDFNIVWMSVWVWSMLLP